MQTLHTKRHIALLLSILAALAIIAPSPLNAQSAWDKIKQQAKQAGQQQQQQQQQQQRAPQQQPSAQSPTPAYQHAASGPTAGSEPDSSCCTPEAMKKMAAEAGFLDIVGIKLGMTPQQATAAIKAHNPALHMYQVNLRLTHPGANNFDRVPHYIVACNNCMGKSVPVGAEVIILEFTIPPSPPLLAAASRYVNFEPTLLGNLVNGLDKKYGPEFPESGSRVWMFDASGKPVTTMSPTVRYCARSGEDQVVHDTGWAGYAHGGSFPPEDRDDGGLDVSTFGGFQNGISGSQQLAAFGKAQCMPYSTIRTDLYTDLGPNTQVRSVYVKIANAALIYASERAAHEWLQAEADAKVKEQHDAAAKRTGTTF